MAYDLKAFNRGYRRAKRAGWHKRIETEADKRAVAEGCFFAPDAGQRVTDFLSTFCRHSKGRFSSQLFVPLEWQRERLIMPLYGWLRPKVVTRANGTSLHPRRFTYASIWIPKKQGKSTLCSGLGLYHLTMDREDGAHIYGAASDIKQAGLVFDEAANMVEKDPHLSSHIEVIRSTKRLYYRATQSFWAVLSEDAFRSEGIDASTVIFDELHAQKYRVLWDALYRAGRARTQPLNISISTAGNNRETVGYEQYSHAKAILEGKSDDTMTFALIYEAGADDDWTNPRTWRKANPSLGVTTTEEDMAADCERAQKSPAEESNFKRYLLNIWTTSSVKAIHEKDWNACRRQISLEDYKGRPCYTGMDLATTTDIAALVYLFPEDDGSFAIFPFFWVPAVGAEERERRDIAPYTRWIRERQMESIPGRVMQFPVIRKRLIDDIDRFNFKACGYDPWNASESALALQGEGFEMVKVRQGWGSMSEPSKRFERLILEEKIHHAGNQVMDWMVGNLMWMQDAKENRSPAKESDSQKIDGCVAAIMALAVAMLDEGPKDSVYETEDLLII